jgi:hypothetical protein
MTFQATPRELAFSSGHNNNFKGADQSGTEKCLIVHPEISAGRAKELNRGTTGSP